MNSVVNILRTCTRSRTAQANRRCEASGTVIWFLVMVPVLSEQMTVVAPRASTAGRRRTIAFRRDIRVTPSASVTVTTIGSPACTVTHCARMERLNREPSAFGNGGDGEADGDGEHAEDALALQCANHKDDAHDREREHRQLLPDFIHLLLQGCLHCFHLLRR